MAGLLGICPRERLDFTLFGETSLFTMAAEADLPMYAVAGLIGGLFGACDLP